MSNNFKTFVVEFSIPLMKKFRRHPSSIKLTGAIDLGQFERARKYLLELFEVENELQISKEN